MTKSRIDWTDFSWNPVVGCKGGCPYCYAKRINDRFSLIPDWDIPVFFPQRLYIPFPKKPARIFVGSMSDIFFWKPEWMEKALDKIRQHPQHTFYFLTKKPECYPSYLFPNNCWLGASITGTETNQYFLHGYSAGMENKRFFSYEPLLSQVVPITFKPDWVIIGAMTGPGSQVHQPKREWVEGIVNQCRDLGIPVFLKGNLAKALGQKSESLIQEIPKEADK